MRVVELSSALLLLVPAATLATAEHVDLHCNGTESVAHPAGERVETYAIIYRIALGEAKGCRQDCREVRTLAGVSDARLVLETGSSSAANERVTSFTVVDRPAGGRMPGRIAFRQDERKPLPLSIGDGKCRRTLFSGFPK